MDLYLPYIDAIYMNSVGSWTRINVSYVSAFLVARLAAFYICNCVLGQFPFLTVLVLCQLTCSGGLLYSFSLVASWYGVYL